jgi:hypothetical protein
MSCGAATCLAAHATVAQVPPEHDLAAAARLVVPQRALTTTWDALAGFGEHGCEGLVLWLGSADSGEGRVEKVLVPPQQPIRNEEGVGYLVSANTLAQLNRELYRRGLRLVAQVHSHPQDAFHSAADDRYAIVTEEGGFSLVVPFFAELPPLVGCAVYRLKRGVWRKCDVRQAITVL